MPRPAEIRDFGRLVQGGAYAVPHIAAYDRKAVRLHIGLHRAGNIGDAAALAGVPDTLIEALPGYLDQLLGLLGNLPAGDGRRAVAMEAADIGAHVDLDDIALMDHPFGRGDTVDNLVVDGYAGAPREAAVAEEGGRSARVLDCLADNPVDFACSNPRPHRVGGRLTGDRCQAAGRPHERKLMLGLDINHA